MCPSFPTDVLVQRLDEDVENEEEIQLVPQVNAVTHQSAEQLREEMVSQVDSPSSNLVGTPEVSVSIARVTASDSATVCRRYKNFYIMISSIKYHDYHDSDNAVTFNFISTFINDTFFIFLDRCT